MPQLRAQFYWLLGSILYFFWFGYIVGIRNEHYFIYVLSAILFFVSPTTRQWFYYLSVWIFYWMVYDSMRIAPNYAVNPVHIQEPYLLEKQIFGIPTGQNGEVQTLNEWVSIHNHPILDLLAGILYISWVPLPLLFAAWLLRRDPKPYLQFAWCFFLVNIIGFIIYYLYPAAPPWYVAENGFALNHNVPRSAAGLNRVDQLIDFPLFHTIYTRNSNVFAAIPSLHSAYPLVGWLYARKFSYRIWHLVFACTSIGIWLTAIYTGHHYVIDILAGIAVALLGYLVYEFGVLKYFKRIFS
jgi:inositol phosphorylceramide synthase catalytic subunit